jgi:hypothetical protein
MHGQYMGCSLTTHLLSRPKERNLNKEQKEQRYPQIISPKAIGIPSVFRPPVPVVFPYDGLDINPDDQGDRIRQVEKALNADRKNDKASAET